MTVIQAEKLRDYNGVVTNTDIWSGFALRPNDVIVCTPPKSGTTWMLNIVMMLIYGRAVPEAGNSRDAPWLDCGFRDRSAIAASLDALDRRRCIKTHTPLDGVLYARDLPYVVVYRHPVDVHFSMRTHARNMKQDWLDYLYDGTPKEAFRRFLDAPLTDGGTDDLSLASIVHHFRMSRARRAKGNVHFFHYADLTRDPAGQIARLAGLLSIDIDLNALDEIVEATSFASMRKAEEQSERRFAAASPFHDQADFFASGTSNKWEGELDAADMALYRRRIGELLPAEDIAWLEWGDRRAP